MNSNTQRNRMRQPAAWPPHLVVIWVLTPMFVIAMAAVAAGQHVGHAITDSDVNVPADPFEVFFATLDGTLPWPRAGWVIVAAAASVLMILVVLVYRLATRSRRKQSRVDKAARFMARRDDLAAYTRKGAAAKAKRFGVAGAPGVKIGDTIIGNDPFYASWEDVIAGIAGTRTSKTTSLAVPAVLDAPGAVMVTSVKRDIVDATRDVRQQSGHRVWVFDPQGIATEEPAWWWNPLSYVTDENKAATLAQHFATGSRPTNAKTDAYFEPAGESLLASLLLAAALDHQPITQVYSWLTQPTDDRPAEILREHGFDLSADHVGGVISYPDKQRAGIYGTAQQMASCLANRRVAEWITRRGHTDARPEFNPHQFLSEAGTLYSMSRKRGRSSAGPLVTALTVAVLEAAEEQASRSAGGRLPTPLVGVLDEAANVVPWQDLPELYSHYGSRGIVLMTLLQTWSQGVAAWGHEGMRTLWSSSNVKIYAGGVTEPDFLRALSDVIGDRDAMTTSVSTSNGGGARVGLDRASVQRQLKREKILEVSDLSALPHGRAIVIPSGAPATLLRLTPWMSGPHADAVRESIAAHDPQADQTLAMADGDSAKFSAETPA